MSKVAVLGLGNWGTALAQQLARNGHEVLAWSIEKEIVDGVNRRNENSRFFPGLKLSSNISASEDLSDTFCYNLFLLTLPSQALSEVIPKLHLSVKNALLVSAVKGMEKETLQTPLQFVAEQLPQLQRAVLSGPSFASDVISGRPVGVVAASEKQEVVEKVVSLFHSETFRVYTSNDPLGVEFGGISKNVIALAAGVIDGLGLGDSARAGLITRGLAEMMRLAEALGAQSKTLAGLSGLGDLIMTASCDQSRNRQTGLRLGKGEKLESILESLGSVAEGVKTTALILELSKREGVEMPICEAVLCLLQEKLSPQDFVSELLQRPVTSEF